MRTQPDLETDYGLANLIRIEEGLRNADHVQINGGVLVAQILVDTTDAWGAFLRELIEVVKESRQ